METIRQRFDILKTRYERYFPALFFGAGFLFDIVTLSRIDDTFTLAQQGFYLLLLTVIMIFRYRESISHWQPTSPRLIKLWHYNNEALHFVLGSLLSSYTLFYFLSSSFATSFAFMLGLGALLVVNEFPAFQSKGLHLKFALFSICLFSYLFILAPMALGRLGFLPFLLAIVLGLSLMLLIWYKLEKLKPGPDAKKAVLAPTLIVAGALVILYGLKILPPIPLSIQYIGIYHDIERVKIQGTAGGPSADGSPAGGSPTGGNASGAISETKYILKYDRPWWKFWQNGAQTFHAYTGDRIHCFVRIFSPANFADEVVYHFLLKTPRGWESQDRIPNRISGGREEGFRGYAVKSNFQSGEWRVQVETQDGREIGRIGFEVEKTDGPPPPDRQFLLETQ